MKNSLARVNMSIDDWFVECLMTEISTEIEVLAQEMCLTSPKDWSRVSHRMHERLRSIESEIQESIFNQIDDLFASSMIAGEDYLMKNAMTLYAFLTETQDLANGIEPQDLFLTVQEHSDCPADFIVIGFVVRVFWSPGFRHLSCFMHVTRLLVAVVPRLLFFAGFGYVSFSLAEFAIELLFVGSAFSYCVALPVASKALFCAFALCVLVLFPILFVGS